MELTEPARAGKINMRITTIHYPVEGWRENPLPFGKEIDMTLKFQKKVFTQRGGGGRQATEPMVRISENGQLSFNKLAIEPSEGL